MLRQKVNVDICVVHSPKLEVDPHPCMTPRLMHVSLLENCQHGVGQSRCVWLKLTQRSQPEMFEEAVDRQKTSSEVTEVVADIAESRHISVTDPSAQGD